MEPIAATPTWADTIAVSGPDFQLSLGEVVQAWKAHGVLRGMLEQAAADRCVREMARRERITVSVEELQTYADRFRMANGLQSAEATSTWLLQNGLDPDGFEAAVERGILEAKLMAIIPQDQVQKCFDETPDRFARAWLWQIVVPSEGVGHELVARLTEEGADFADVARSHSLDPTARTTGGDLGVLRRWNLPEPVAGCVFSAEPGAIIGPIVTDEGVKVFRVAEVLSPGLDVEADSLIRQMLYEKCLRQQLESLDLTPLLRDRSSPNIP